MAAAIGFCWALGMAHFRMDDRLAPELEGTDVEVVGIVASLPAAGERSLRFEFEPELVASPASARLPQKILLSWYRSPLDEEQPSIASDQVHPGERWRFTVRLRRPHGQLNPHGFDYEAWLLERGIGGSGYVRSSKKASPEKLGERNSLSDRIEQIRESVRDRFKRVLGETPASGILAALAVGDQRSITAEEWRLFNRTGVTHLMSISGLHVTLISGLFACLAGWLWRRSPFLVLRLPARKAAAAAAIAGALGYSDRRLRGARAAHLLDGDRGRDRALVGAHRLARPRARAGAGGGTAVRSLGGARGGLLAVVWGRCSHIFYIK